MFAKHHEQFSRINGNSILGTRLMHTLDGDMANMDWGWGLGLAMSWRPCRLHNSLSKL